MLAIGIHYLNGWAMATDPTNRNQPEWPPHPDRVFMALAAAHFETDGDEDERSAIEWIEDLPAVPDIHASKARNRSTLACYVPPNDLEPPDPLSGKNGKLVKKIRHEELTESNLRSWLKQVRAIKKSTVVSRAFGFLELRDRVAAELQSDHPSVVLDLLAQTAHELSHDLGSIDWKDYAQDALAVLPGQRSLNLKERSFPVVVPEEDTVFLVWREATPSDKQRSILQSLCEKVIRIGHSASFVQMWVADEQSIGELERHQRHVPRTSANVRLRVSGMGRLADLEASFNRADVDEYFTMQQQVDEPDIKPAERKKRKAAIKKRFGDRVPESRRPDIALWHGYDIQSDDEAELPSVSSQFANMIILKQEGGRRFGLESTLQLSQALRATVMKFSGVQPVPEWMSGHRANSQPAQRDFGHMAFSPLPHVGSHHADGHVLGMAMIPPSDIDQVKLAKAIHPILFDPSTGRANRIKLTLGNIGDCVLEAADGSEGRVNLEPSTWSKASKRWATVTPIALDRHAKTDDPWQEVTETIRLACSRIRLNEPVDVIPTPVSMFIGAPTSQDMPRIARKAGGKIRQTHAIITFDEPVSGPVLLGAGRYRGYGLCRPIDCGG